jgi:hypothetical protein
LHGPADVALAVADDVDERPAVKAQHHGPSHIRVVKGRRIAVDDQVAADPARGHLADRTGLLARDVL